MKFTVIVPHYDQSITDEQFVRGLNCLAAQTFQDFEIRAYHDGPTSRGFFGRIDYENLYYEVTEKRMNDWGHSNRDLGIKEAKGEYIVHFNPDNILYPNCLEELNNLSKESLSNPYASNDILIFPIRMNGMQTNGHFLWRDRATADKKTMIFTGYPPMKYNIDCMQLVMKTSLWRAEGGWYDKSEEGDSNMYPYFVRKYGARYCAPVLGEHN